MKILNIVTLVSNVFIIIIFVYLDYDMASSPVDIYSDGQAGIGVGIFVLIIQILRLFLLVGFTVYVAVVVVTKSVFHAISIINIVLFAIGLILGYEIIN